MSMTRLLLLCFALLACGSDESAATTCTPNETQPCACPSGPAGHRTCDSAGSAFSACECGSAGTAGASNGGSAGSAGEGGGGTGAGGTAGSAGVGGSTVCVSGQTMACACTNGQTGAQSCNSDGSGYDDCVCTGGTGGSGGSGPVCLDFEGPTGQQDDCLAINGPDTSSLGGLYCPPECNAPKYAYVCDNKKAPHESCVIYGTAACCPKAYCQRGSSNAACSNQSSANMWKCHDGAAPESNCTHLDGYDTVGEKFYCCPQLF